MPVFGPAKCRLFQGAASREPERGGGPARGRRMGLIGTESDNH
jgi:hypothetical protein